MPPPASPRASKLDYAAEICGGARLQRGSERGQMRPAHLRRTPVPLHPPRQGHETDARIVREIVASENDGADQGISEVAQQLVLSQKKAAMVIMISDFWGEHNKAALGQLNFKHDFIPIRIADPMELHLPDAGRVILKDPETGKNMFLNLSRQDVRDAHANSVHLHRKKWTQDFRRLGIDFLGPPDHGQLHAAASGPLCPEVP